MLVQCPICSDVLLPSDHLSSTPCGHIFHETCVSRWLASNTTCPQCRQECLQQNVHRIYLPEVNFQDNDQLYEKMNELNRLRLEAESKAKKVDTEKKLLERDLKKRKKEFHKVMQRSKNLRKNNGPSTSSYIPSQRFKSTMVNIFLSRSTDSARVKEQSTIARRQIYKRNVSRQARTKAYFVRKREDRLRAEASRPSREEEAENSEVVAVINVSSDDSSTN